MNHKQLHFLTQWPARIGSVSIQVSVQCKWETTYGKLQEMSDRLQLKQKRPSFS